MDNGRNNKKLIWVTAIALVLVLFAMVYALIRWNTSDDRITSVTNNKMISLSWWGNDGRHMYTMEGVDLFQEKNSGIDVTYRYGVWNGYEKRNKVWMESHTEADVMQINYAWLDEYSPDGTGYYDLYKLADYIELDNFTEDERVYGEKNGALNALPIAMNTQTFYYNKDILDSYSFDVPETWDDLKELAVIAKKDDKYVLGMPKKQLFLFLIAYYEQSTGEKVFDEDGRFILDKDGVIYVLTYYRELIDEHVICPIESFDRSKYISGDIIGTMCWISDTKIYCDGLIETGTNVIRGSYPKKPNAKTSGWYIKPATMWAISADTRNPKEAAKLLNYLLNDSDMAKLQQTEKGVPVSDASIKALQEEGLSDTEEFKATQEMEEHILEMNLMIPNMENENIIDAFKSGADEYLYDKMTIEECATKIIHDIREVEEAL